MCVALFWTTLSSILVLSLMLTMVLEAQTNRVLHDYSTHVMVDDSRRTCPRSVLQADTIYRELRTGEF